MTYELLGDCDRHEIVRQIAALGTRIVQPFDLRIRLAERLAFYLERLADRNHNLGAAGRRF